LSTLEQVGADSYVRIGRQASWLFCFLALEEVHMVITSAHLSPILSILFGVLILIVPRFLSYLVAIYLILAGLLGLGLVRF
jgi:uncharacterized membrane protein